MKRDPDEPSGKSPGFYLYPDDLEKELRPLPVPAQALWTRMLLRMHWAKRRGYMEHATGEPFTPEDIARTMGMPIATVTKMLDVMEHKYGTFSRDDKGVIYNRRMVNDTELSAKRKAAGRLGGNPKLVGMQVNQNGNLHNQKSNQIPTPSREEEKGNESGNGIGTTALLDDFKSFCVVAAEAGMSTAPGDIANAEIEWRHLDFEQKLAAVKDVPLRVAIGEYSDPTYVPLPATYLKGRYWFRPQKPKRADKQERAIEVFHELMEDRIGKAKSEVQPKRLA